MKKVISRGFTLIELLVVIAIIGILASIVLVSLNTARSKGKDTRVISDVNQARTQLESDVVGSVYQDLYAGTISTTDIVGILTTSGPGNANLTTLNTDANTNGGANLVYHITTNSTPGAVGGPANATAYAIYGKTSTGYFCVDSTGNNSTNTASGPIPTIANATDAAICGK